MGFLYFSAVLWMGLQLSPYSDCVTGGSILGKILQEIQPHREIYIVTDSTSGFIDEQGLPEALSTKFLSSAHNWGPGKGEFNFWKNLRHHDYSMPDVAIVLNMTAPDFIFKEIEHIGNNSRKFPDFRRIWTIAVWPTPVGSHEEIKQISLLDGFVQSVSKFQVNSNLFFAFNLTTTSGVEESQGLNDVTRYEAYMAGNVTIFSHLPSGLMLWNCNQCIGAALRRFNFHQRKLKITAVNDTEVTDDIHVYQDANGTISFSQDGFSAEMLAILKNMLNFTYDSYWSRQWGDFNTTSNRWEGSVGDVAYEKVDLSISITNYLPNRAAVLTFLPPASEHIISGFFTPSDINTIRDIFSQPFELDLWIAVIATWLALALSMIIFSVIRKRYATMPSQDGDEEPEPDFTKDSFIWALGTACQQGWDEHPKAGSLRTIFISGSFTGVVAYAGYSAAIVSTLSLRVDPIQSPLDLLKSNLRVGIRKGIISNLLEQNNTHDTMSLYNARVQSSGEEERYLNVSGGLKRLLKHPYAFITTRETMYDLLKLTEEDKIICAIKDLPILKFGFPIGYPVPKSSPFKEILRYAMIMIREPGVLWRLRMKYSFKRRCLEASDNAGNALGPNDVFTAFMILIGGFALSVTFLAVERMIPLTKITYIQ